MSLPFDLTTLKEIFRTVPAKMRPVIITGLFGAALGYQKFRQLEQKVERLETKVYDLEIEVKVKKEVDRIKKQFEEAMAKQKLANTSPLSPPAQEGLFTKFLRLIGLTTTAEEAEQVIMTFDDKEPECPDSSTDEVTEI